MSALSDWAAQGPTLVAAAEADLAQTVTEYEADLQAALARAEVAEKALVDHMATHAPPVVVIADHTVPADAIWFHPEGSDTATGTQDKPRRTPLAGRFNVGEGLHQGFAWSTPRGPKTTIASRGLVLDGGGVAKSALVASGVTDLLGDLIVQNYAPAAKNNGSNAPIYYGGESTGSLVDGLTVRQSKMAAIGFQNQITLRNFTAEDIGYSAIMGAGANDTLLENITLRRVNRGGYTQDGQLGACKLAFSRRVVVRGFTLEDCPNGNGLWLDMGCQGADLSGIDISGAGTDGKSTMRHGLHPEITVGVKIRGFKVRGATSGGLMVLDSADVDAAEGDLRGNFVGAWFQRDSRVNVGKDPRDGTPAENPWDTLRNRIRNVTFDGPNQLWAYSEATAPKQLPGESFFDEIRGCWFGPTQPTGMQIRMDRTRKATVAQLAANPAFGPNYLGADPAEAAKVRVLL